MPRKCVVCKDKNPYYNFKGEKTATHCKACSEPTMVNIKSRKCVVCEEKIPNFNYIGETKGSHCSSCKEKVMVDVRTKKCVECKIKQPAFNYQDQKTPEYCGDCKTENMVNVLNKLCVVCEENRPIYNLNGQKRPTHCKDCKTEEMVNVNNKMCVICENKIPSFNIKGKSVPLYCGSCKLEDMVDLRSTKCEHEKQKVNCIICSPKIACQSCLQVMVNNSSRFKPYCFNCYCVLNPEEEITKKYRVKETYVREFLQDKFGEKITMVFDRKIDIGCSTRRPDVLMDFGSFVMTVECDEKQHKHKDYDCENKRMMEIFQDCGGNRPLVFIRFNPDSYVEGNKKYKGCFETTLSCLKIDEVEFTKRMEEVVIIMKKYIKEEPMKEITIVQLFYDN